MICCDFILCVCVHTFSCLNNNLEIFQFQCIEDVRREVQMLKVLSRHKNLVFVGSEYVEYNVVILIVVPIESRLY
jgi:hypothetical protein